MVLIKYFIQYTYKLKMNKNLFDTYYQVFEIHSFLKTNKNSYV
jgi:hypothetical protein